MDDIQLYQGLDWLERKHIVGKVQGYVYSSKRVLTKSVKDLMYSPITSDFYPTLAMSQSPWYASPLLFPNNFLLNRYMICTAE